jgi:hypothetical protein
MAQRFTQRLIPQQEIHSMSWTMAHNLTPRLEPWHTDSLHVLNHGAEVTVTLSLKLMTHRFTLHLEPWSRDFLHVLNHDAWIYSSSFTITELHALNEDTWIHSSSWTKAQWFTPRLESERIESLNILSHGAGINSMSWPMVQKFTPCLEPGRRDSLHILNHGAVICSTSLTIGQRFTHFFNHDAEIHNEWIQYSSCSMVQRNLSHLEPWHMYSLHILNLGGEIHSRSWAMAQRFFQGTCT